MVARALGKEIWATRDCALVGDPALAYGSCRVSDQGKTLSASDLNNARATILIPFSNMEYRIMKKTGQNKTWIEVYIACITFTPDITLFFLYKFRTVNVSRCFYQG